LGYEVGAGLPAIMAPGASIDVQASPLPAARERPRRAVEFPFFARDQARVGWIIQHQ
jgi:hypothetical protein